MQKCKNPTRKQYREKLLDIGFGNKLFGDDIKAQLQNNNNKKDKWDYIELKSFCRAEIHRTKRSSKEQEKTFPNHISDKGLI